MRVRFAPSPTGHLHVGNARTAMFNWLFARNRGGALVLRIEDTDVERSTPQSEVSILDDLRWLGLDWDEGPDIGGSFGPYRQSERLDTYGQHVEGLLTRQRAYYCFCSPQQLEQDRRLAVAEGRPATYSGRCRGIERDEARSRLAAGVPAAVRFRVPDLQEVGFDDLVRGRVSFRAEVIGDPIILRSDGRPAYNFAVVVDDALMGITHVVRGEDHISNTPRQVLVVRGARIRSASFCASGTGARPGPYAVVEASRSHVRVGISGERLLAGSPRELSGAHWLVTRQR